jgi:molybdenum cofactor cytidylyltransferase
VVEVGLAQIVLAAGRSERMGEPKALLDFDGRSALSLVVGAAAVAGVGRSIVVIGPDGQAIHRAYSDGEGSLEVEWVVNLLPRSAQLQSLQAGLGRLEAGAEVPQGFFIHPVDYPLAGAADYRLLIEVFRRMPADPASVFVLSHGRRRGHPVLCRAELARELLALGPEGTARQVIERHEIRHVTTPNGGVLEDMDTPDDYRRLLELYRERSRGS